MKKFLSFMVMALVMVFPFAVKADVEIINPACTGANANDEITCTIKAKFTDGNTDSLTATLTERGGADIISVQNVATSNWVVGQTSESNNVWTVPVTLNAPGQAGEFELFTVVYKASGSDDCEIGLALGETETTITPTEPKNETPKGKCTYDKTANKYYIDGVEVTESQYKEQCPPTGSTLPYLSLGAIVLIAASAYVATKNKTKMYKI